MGSALLLLSLAGSSLVFTSCTTEEGVVAGALAGAAIGGLVGHSSENKYKRNRNYYRGDRYRYDDGYRYDDYDYGYRNRGRAYYPSSYTRYSGGYSDPYCY